MEKKSSTERVREWREKNREKFNEYHRKYRKKNRKRVAEYQKRYRERRKQAEQLRDGMDYEGMEGEDMGSN